jgi:hypothetical protein
MNLDDETLLSAYLDDELDEAGRLHVEEALLGSPRLAQQLRDLALVRDLAVGLGRPAPSYDLSAPVLNRIAGRLPGGFPLHHRLVRHVSSRTRRLLLGAGLATAAAAVLMAVTLALVVGPGGPLAPPARPVSGVASAAPTTAAHPVVAERGGSPAIASAPKDGPTAVDSPVMLAQEGTSAPAAPAAGLAAPEREGKEDRQFLRRLLDRPDVRRIVIGVDVIDDAADKVSAILERAGLKKPSFGRLSVAQGIVFDPDRPGRAIVFAFVADDPEQEYLVSRIKTQLGDGADLEVEDHPLDARLTTRLAGVVPVEVSQGVIATLGEAPANTKIALRNQPDEDIPPLVRAATTAPPAPDTARYATAPPRADGRGPALSPAPDAAPVRKEEAVSARRTRDLAPGVARRPAAAREPVTVLVWITARDRTRSGPR